MTEQEKWFIENLEEIRDSFEFRLEDILFEIGEKISCFMEEQNLNRAQLADRLGTSRAYVTKILNGNPNLTIKTLLKLSDVLNQELEINLKPKQACTKQKAVVPDSQGILEDLLDLPEPANVSQQSKSPTIGKLSIKEMHDCNIAA